MLAAQLEARRRSARVWVSSDSDCTRSLNQGQISATSWTLERERGRELARVIFAPPIGPKLINGRPSQCKFVSLLVAVALIVVIVVLCREFEAA